ncbi:MAG: translation initiation factor IF-6 [Candidatus Woesearchaeota archaeon]
MHETKDKDHVSILSFNQDPNIGLYAFATDKFCLLGADIDERYEKIIEETLKVPVYRITIAGTSMAGVFIAGNENCILIPEITFDYEIKNLEKLKIPFKVIKSKITALGNTIACNKNAVYVSDEFSSDTKKRIRQALNLPLKPGKIAGLSQVGSCLVLNDKGGLIHRDAEDFELDLLDDFFKVELTEGTINMGSPYVKSGIIANNKGLIIGASSGGPEASNADSALGFVE